MATNVDKFVINVLRYVMQDESGEVEALLAQLTYSRARQMPDRFKELVSVVKSIYPKGKLSNMLKKMTAAELRKEAIRAGEFILSRGDLLAAVHGYFSEDVQD